MSTDAAVELEQLTKRLQACEQRVGNIEGRQQQAEEEMKRLEAECRALGVEPDALDGAIEEAAQQAQAAVVAFGLAVGSLEGAVTQAQALLDGGAGDGQ